MDPRRSLSALRSDATWRYALAFGLAAAAITLARSWPSLESLNVPIFSAALLAGFVAKRRVRIEASPVGVRTGLVCALPVLYQAVEMVEFAATATGWPLWYRLVVPPVVIGAFVCLVAVFSATIGFFGGRVGGWLAERTLGGRPPAATA